MELHRTDEAEPLLLTSYEGLLKRMDKIYYSERTKCQRHAIERLIHLYEARNQPAQAAEWKAKLLAAK